MLSRFFRTDFILPPFFAIIQFWSRHLSIIIITCFPLELLMGYQHKNYLLELSFCHFVLIFPTGTLYRSSHVSFMCVWSNNFSSLLCHRCKPNFSVASSLCQPWAEASRWLYVGDYSLGLILTSSLGPSCYWLGLPIGSCWSLQPSNLLLYIYV